MVLFLTCLLVLLLWWFDSSDKESRLSVDLCIILAWLMPEVGEGLDIMQASGEDSSAMANDPVVAKSVRSVRSVPNHTD